MSLNTSSGHTFMYIFIEWLYTAYIIFLLLKKCSYVFLDKLVNKYLVFFIFIKDYGVKN